MMELKLPVWLDDTWVRNAALAAAAAGTLSVLWRLSSSRRPLILADGKECVKDVADFPGPPLSGDNSLMSWKDELLSGDGKACTFPLRWYEQFGGGKYVKFLSAAWPWWLKPFISVPPLVFCYDCKIARTLLVDGQQNYLPGHFFKRSDMAANATETGFGRGSVISLRGPEWSAKRRILTPHFQLKVLYDSALPYIQRCAEKIRAECEAAAKTETGLLRIDPVFTSATMNVIMYLLFEEDVEYDTVTIQNGLNGILRYLAWTHSTPFVQRTLGWWQAQRRLGAARDTVNSVLADRVRATMTAARQGPAEAIRGRGIVGLLAASGKYTEDEIMAECRLLLTAGYDTTAHTLSFTVGMLAHDQATQEEARREARELMPKGPTKASLQSLEAGLINASFQEALRLFPVAPNVSGEVVHDLSVDGVRIRKGTLVQFPTFTINRTNPSIASPEDFRPSRWLTKLGSEAGAKLKEREEMGENEKEDISRAAAREEEPEKEDISFTLLSFSVGAHQCLGRQLAYLEARAFLGTILKDFELSPPPPEFWPEGSAGRRDTGLAGSEKVPIPSRVQWKEATLLRPLEGMPLIVRRKAN
uniref:Cytochrome P450 n=1 Tax=Chromera velia CCMP2878 TaxID=1169474 RepID=A0A0G4G0H9_9ALVE|eukprot:Cvel_19637.t1-p1 / transcript=Cvel_19637.t1 / gene=Cvel_19637 / organism=Chromera_velia_CCMP2878 / gene_product=Sterol 26-hydroxylase, mitochondrial, putative / transcript_product=Sterol 26-hydroxylase, mitochondrial, putative / location=Cvel_scaffold1710:6288-11908(-) / protein_length=587 / sequence_SO=supercontig / SO=protein_coding / is_pseudo=false